MQHERPPETRTPRGPRRVGILSPGTSEFDSRAQRIARSLVALGDTVTVYSRRRPGLPREETLDGYRIVRIPLDRADARAEQAADQPGGRDRGSSAGAARATAGWRGFARRARTGAWDVLRGGYWTWHRWSDRVAVIHRFRNFPVRPISWGRRFAASDRVEPHDIWHGMWAGSLPMLQRVRRRHGGATVYDPRDVFLRARIYASMPTWQRRILTRIERHWAHEADAVIQVSEPYAAMMQRDLELTDVPIVRNCPDRWDPPDPRPDRIRQALGIEPDIRIVLYQGGLLVDRGIEQSMDAILDVPGAVLVLMGFGNQEARFRQMAASPMYSGKVHVIDAVPPSELLWWSASSDVMVMLYQPHTENHQYVTPQKLWEAMAAGVPVVASDLPGLASVVTPVGCGVLCDPTSPVAIADALRTILAGGTEGLREMGERGHAAAHDRYNWEVQFQVLQDVYARLPGATR